MPSYKEYLQATQSLLRQSQREPFPYLTMVCGREFVVYENVFSPKYFKDTEIFARHLTIKPGERMLEIGSGTGVISVTKALEGAGKVVATDINHEATKNTRDNAQRHGVSSVVDVREGSLFRCVKPEELFDVIFWNLPFGFIERSTLNVLERATFDRRYWKIRLFLEQAPQHLAEGGRIVLGFCSALGKLRDLRSICSQNQLSLNLIYQENSEELYPVQFELFEARPLSQ